MYNVHSIQIIIYIKLVLNIKNIIMLSLTYVSWATEIKSCDNISLYVVMLPQSDTLVFWSLKLIFWTSDSNNIRL